MEETYEPSPIQIWQQCSKLQATWTREEERKRRGAGKVEWLPPGCTSALRLDTPSRLERQ